MEKYNIISEYLTKFTEKTKGYQPKIKKDAIIPKGWSKGRIFKEGYKNVRD